MSQRKILEKADREEKLNNIRNWKLYAEGMYARTHHEKYNSVAKQYQNEIDDILEMIKREDELERKRKQEEANDKLVQYTDINQFFKNNKDLVYEGLKGAYDEVLKDKSEASKKIAAKGVQKYLEDHIEERKKTFEKQKDLFEDNSS